MTAKGLRATNHLRLDGLAEACYSRRPLKLSVGFQLPRDMLSSCDKTQRLRRQSLCAVVGSSENALRLPLLVDRDERKKRIGKPFCPLVARCRSGLDLVERKQPTVASVAEFARPIP